MKRVVEPEWLDELPADDPGAAGSRRDLRLLNRIMGHAAILSGLLESATAARAPKRIVELGAGDGTLLLSLARKFSSSWPGVEVILVDCKNVVTAETMAAFKSSGWPARIVTADIFDWLRTSPDATDIITTNLFLHQFPTSRLADLLDLAAARTRIFAACEPLRGRLPLVSSWLVGFIGCNAVTRHDAVLSVQAGFTGCEISNLWPDAENWQLQERRAGLFTHAFLAARKS